MPLIQPRSPSVSPSVNPVDASPVPKCSTVFDVHANTVRERLSLKGLGEALHVVLQGTAVAQELHVSTIDLDAASSLLLQVLVAAEGGETPVLGDDDLLATRELVLGAAEGLEGESTVWFELSACTSFPILLLCVMHKGSEHTGVTGADAQDDLANVDTGDSAVGLAPGTTHTSLQSIGTGARQHLVDTDDVEGVGADAHVETLLAGVLDEVLVGADTGGLEGLGTQLLILVGDHVDAEREIIDGRTLTAQVEDADLGIGHTTVEPGLGVGLVKEVRLAIWSCVDLLHEVIPQAKKTGSLQVCKRLHFDMFSISRGFSIKTAVQMVSVCSCQSSSFDVFADFSRSLRFLTEKSSCSRLTSIAHLVLAVAVATSRATRHFD